VWGCASEEIPKYGDPAEVAGGVGGSGASGTTTTTGSGGSGGACTPDDACAVKFAADVFPILDTTAKCATALCHGDEGSSPGGFKVTAGDAASYYGVLTTFVLEGGGDYIVPCDPDSSKLLCNLKASDGDNPRGECGKKTMPLSSSDAPTLAQIKDIEDWIACGAPNN
jgi:hypothetical protein